MKSIVLDRSDDVLAEGGLDCFFSLLRADLSEAGGPEPTGSSTNEGDSVGKGEGS